MLNYWLTIYRQLPVWLQAAATVWAVVAAVLVAATVLEVLW